MIKDKTPSTSDDILEKYKWRDNEDLSPKDRAFADNMLKYKGQKALAKEHNDSLSNAIKETQSKMRDDFLKFLKNLQNIQKQDKIDSLEIEVQLKQKISKLAGDFSNA